MPTYCVNKNAQPGSSDHEVHDVWSTYSCLPAPANRVALGSFPSCSGAVEAAKRLYDDVNGCRWCCPSCHTT